jgi:hypothetical protein
VYARIKAHARAAGRAEPHAMMYANSVYDWPFDKQHARGSHHIDVLDVDGVPHAEQCDPGLFPSYFIDHGREAGRLAFLQTFHDVIVHGVRIQPLPNPVRRGVAVAGAAPTFAWLFGTVALRGRRPTVRCSIASTSRR